MDAIPGGKGERGDDCGVCSPARQGEKGEKGLIFILI